MNRSVFADDLCLLNQPVKLNPSEAWPGGQFGVSVDIDGDTAVIGRESGAGGAAYVFSRSNGEWREIQKLDPGTLDVSDRFGRDVAISGETIVVGSEGDDDNGSVAGAAYVFTLQDGMWEFTIKLLPSDGQGSWRFGHSVAIDGDTMAIGAYEADTPIIDQAGAVYVYENLNGSWTEKAKLYANDGSRLDDFSHALAVHGDIVVSGAQSWDAPDVFNNGAVYSFERHGDTWTQTAIITQTILDQNGNFGHSVDFDGNHLIVGAWDAGPYSAGLAYIFSWDGSEWHEMARLAPINPTFDDRFGISVAIHGETALVGAEYDDDGGINAGAVYLYQRSGGAWVESAKLVPDDSEIWQLFGRSVVVQDNTAIVGSPYWYVQTNAIGAAYIYIVDCPRPGDIDGDGDVDAFDRALFCFTIGFSEGSGAYFAAADLSPDDTIDENDLALFNAIMQPCLTDIVASQTFAPPADGATDAADLGYLLSEWGGAPSCADLVDSGSFQPPPDGVVNGADLAFLLGEWGPCE